MLGSLSFCCVIALEYSLSFSNLSGEPSLHPVSIQRKEMKFALMIFRWAVMSVTCMKKNGMIVLMKKFQLKKMMFWWSFLHPTDPSVHLHWPANDDKCCMPVHDILQLLLIPTVSISGHPYTFLKSEFKDTQKQFTENLWTWKHSFINLTIEICSSTSNSLIIIGNFRKHLTLIHIKASFCSLYGYSWLFQWIYIWNNKMKYLKG